MPKRSFRDPVTNILKSWGYTSSNISNDVSQVESDSFKLEPGKFRWNGSAWVAVPQSELDIALTTAQRLDASRLLSLSDAQSKLLRAVADVLKDEINLIRAAIPRGILSITRTNNVATVITRDPHGLTTGETIRIQGTTLAAYNVTGVATVVNTTTFTYPVAGTPVSPAVGPAIQFTMGVVPSMSPRTLAQVRTAITAKIDSGTVDT